MAYINTRDTLGDQTTLDMIVARELAELKEEENTTLVSYALYGNTGLQSVEMPGLASSAPGSYAFAGCSSLVSAAFPNLKSLGQFMFQSCIALRDVSAPEAIYGGNAAFYGCMALESAIFPKMSYLSANMFYNCTKLTTISFSASLAHIEASCFYNCMALRDVSFPNVKSIGGSAFQGCAALMTPSFPSATSIGRSAFYNAVVDKLVFPSATTLSRDTTNLAVEVDFSAKPSIAASAFAWDYNLMSLVLRNASQLTLANTNALTSTPIASGIGHIFVPSELVDTYKSATNWATYANQIVSLDEYPKEVVTGTITDSWADILAAENDGTYSSKYSVGDTKVVNIGAFPMLMQIVAMDTDELADDTGNAKITWLSTNLPLSAMMNPENTNAGGCEVCSLRTSLMQVLYDNMESTVKATVKSVKKTFYDKTSSSTKTVNDKVWIPSLREIFGALQSGAESSGCIYTGFFTANANRIKNRGILGIGSVSTWWLRSALSNVDTNFWSVNSSGGTGTTGHFSGTHEVAFGFCT